MLGGLATFVGNNFAAAAALQPARAESEIELADDVGSSFLQFSARQLRQSALARYRPHGHPAPPGPERRAPAEPRPTHPTSPHTITPHHDRDEYSRKCDPTAPHLTPPHNPSSPILTPPL